MYRPMSMLLAGGIACLLGGVLLAQPGPSTIVPPDRAVIIVRVPTDATVTVGAQVSSQKGPERTFTTPALQPGFTYSYEIVARWSLKGQEKTVKRTVQFQPGQAKIIDLVQAESGVKTDPGKKVETKKDPEKKVETKRDPEKKVETKRDSEKKSEPKKDPEKKVETKKVSEKKAKKDVWTDAKDPTLPADFRFQGEYVRDDKDHPLGCQIIALGHGNFQAVVLPGGLPGAGWNGKEKSLMEGTLEGDHVVFKPASGKRHYLAQSPAEFSATSKFPPAGQKMVSGSTDGKVLNLQLSGSSEMMALKKITRKSPTLKMPAPGGATILFDGASTDEWEGGRLDKERGTLNTDGHDIRTKKRFNNYSVHAEFMLPYRPDARGQGRGNSGFYQVMQYEVQILDSFGLEGKNNECGGVYTRIEPKLNMCLPPLQWQTYDIEFTNAVPESKDSKKVAKRSRITVKLNGVVIIDDAEIAGPTGGAWNQPEGTPGPLLLQGHGNPLQFRNIWVAEKK